MKRIKIMVVISSLAQGGAEAMLYKLLSGIDEKKFSCFVVSMIDMGVYGEKIQLLNIPVVCLRMNRSPYCFTFLYKYFVVIKNFKPDIVQGWMYHANMFSYFVKLVSPRTQILFNIRHSLSKLSYEKIATRQIIRVNAWLSFFAKKVINNSKKSIKQHESIGFSKKNSIYIANGFDTNMFQPSSREYFAFRNKYSFTKETKIVGNIARFHPMKNHEGFLDVCKKVYSLYDGEVKFVLAGRDIDNNKKLQEKAKILDILDHCIFLGNVVSSEILPVFDVYLSTSLWGEGFPNVIGEAMACGVPCVATDVGDCQSIIGSFGHTAKPGDSNKLANYCIQLLENPVHGKEEIRRHIIDNYSIGKIVSQYEALYKKLMEK